MTEESAFSPRAEIAAGRSSFSYVVKQTLNIPRFLGTSENAVCIQVAIALIAFLRLAQATQKAIASPLHRSLAADRPLIANPVHLAIQWPQSQTGHSWKGAGGGSI
jgi:hypothetical protein